MKSVLLALGFLTSKSIRCSRPRNGLLSKSLETLLGLKLNRISMKLQDLIKQFMRWSSFNG